MPKTAKKGTSGRSVILQDGTPLPASFARSILMASPAITYVYDAIAGRSVFQNRSLRDLLGHPPGDGVQSSWVELMHPDDQARFPAHRERLRAIEQGQILSWEYRLRTPQGDWRWFQSRDTLLSEGPGSKLIVGNAADVSEQKRAQERGELLLGEMRHRGKNFSAIMRAIAAQSAPRSPEAVEAFNRFVSRLSSLLDAGDLLLASEERRASLRAIVRISLKPFMPDMEKAMLDGPEIDLPEQATGGLSLIVHELATNATKYGLLAKGGRVELDWVQTDGTVTFEWREEAAPDAQSLPAEGFGSRLLRGIAKPGSFTMELSGGKLICKFALSTGGSGPV